MDVKKKGIKKQSVKREKKGADQKRRLEKARGINNNISDKEMRKLEKRLLKELREFNYFLSGL